MPDTLPDIELTTDSLVLPGCEHPVHPKGGLFHRDGGEHYVRFHSPCGHYGPEKIKVVCGTYLARVKAEGVRCLKCPDDADMYTFQKAVTDLGPVASFF